jgi:hypothetical protein
VIRRSGRIGTVAATILLAVAGASGSVVAADPVVSATVAFEATLTVRFTDAGTLLPVEAAQVHVTARQADTVVGEYDGTTDAEGTAVLTGMPIETGDGPAVRLSVVADKSTTSVDAATGCSLAETWHAERADVTVDGPVIEVAFGEAEQDPSSSISCPDTEPTGAVGGVIGTPGITLPPTDTTVPTASSTSDMGAAIVVVFIFSLAGLSLLLRRPRRGDG